MEETKLNIKWFHYMQDIIGKKKEFYAYCTMHKGWASDKPITLWYEASDMRKDSISYPYDYIILEWTERYHNKVWFYSFFSEEMDEIILDDWTFILSDWFMILFPTKEISKSYLKYMDDRRILSEAIELKRLEEVYDEDKAIDEMTLSEIDDYVSELRRYIQILKSNITTWK